MKEKEYNTDNLPNRAELERIVHELKSANLGKVSYEKVFYKILNELMFIPFVTAKLRAGHHIERARINEPGQIFCSESELSYRTDAHNIKKFGRANAPEQAIFYGAIKTEHIEYPRIVNLFETSEIFRNNDQQSVDTFTMTVGKWRIKQDFEIVEMVFNQSNIENIPQIARAYEHHIERLRAEIPDRIDDIEFLLRFFSDEFAKKEIKSDSDYKISVAYTQMADAFKNLPGVTYPSVRTDYYGYNVALTIPAVEAFLDLEAVAMFKVYKKRGHTFIDNLAYTTELGELKSNFKWVDIKGTDEKVINAILLGD